MGPDGPDFRASGAHSFRGLCIANDFEFNPVIITKVETASRFVIGVRVRFEAGGNDTLFDQIEVVDDDTNVIESTSG